MIEPWLKYQLNLNNILRFLDLNKFDFKIPLLLSILLLLTLIVILANIFNDLVVIILE